MAVIGQRPLPPIWPHAKGTSPFLPVLSVATLVNGEFRPNPQALAALSDGTDRTSLAGRLRLTLPNARLVLVGRGRGSMSGITLGGLPLFLTPLGLDAAPPEPPRGFFPFIARVPNGGTLELDLATFKLSQLSVRTT